MKYDIDKVSLKNLPVNDLNRGSYYAVYYDYGDGYEYVCNMRFFTCWAVPNRLEAVGRAKNYCIHNRDYKLVKWLKDELVPK